MQITDCVRFQDYTLYVRSSKNVIAALTNVLGRLHDLPPEDYENIMGRMGKIYTLANRDTGFLVKVIWDTASNGIAGSHLNYIQSIIQKPRQAKSKDAPRDADRYVRGKYGHMVQR
ncbi:MAG: hypothetical protein WC365_03635 [Candidatus Babeliales bacterium]